MNALIVQNIGTRQGDTGVVITKDLLQDSFSLYICLGLSLLR